MSGGSVAILAQAMIPMPSGMGGAWAKILPRHLGSWPPWVSRVAGAAMAPPPVHPKPVVKGQVRRPFVSTVALVLRLRKEGCLMASALRQVLGGLVG